MSQNAAIDSSPIGSRTLGHQAAMYKFAISISLLTIVGHLVLGFEQSFAQPLFAVLIAVVVQIVLESVHSFSKNKSPGFYGGPKRFIAFILPAYISALSASMLLYYSDRLWILGFTITIALCSKTLFRVSTKTGSRHYLNPTNFGLTATIILFPSVGITMPWQWTTELSGAADWAFPVLILILGSIIHIQHASRLYVVIAFIGSFIIQAFIRWLITDASLVATLAPITGVPAAIFAFYMTPDPATSPSSKWGQIAFGSAISAVYFVLVSCHISYGLFYALTVVCAFRGLMMFLLNHYSYSDEANPAFA